SRLFLARVVIRIDVHDVERTRTIDLHDRLFGREGEVRHTRGQMDEARGLQTLCRLIHLLAGGDMKAAGDHGDELVLRVPVRRDDEAAGKLQAQDEWAFLGGTAEQGGCLCTWRERRRRRAPFDL